MSNIGCAKLVEKLLDKEIGMEVLPLVTIIGLEVIVCLDIGWWILACLGVNSHSNPDDFVVS